MTENRCTPKSIAEGNTLFSIPLYQRLFEWEEEQVVQLLTDLYKHFKSQRDEPYYIGVLTVFKKDQAYSLVDGQQRFTVLMLMGIAFGWKAFLLENDEPRLSFFARKKDQEYLQAKITGTYLSASPLEPNLKMEQALKYIHDFLEKKVKIDDKARFNDFVYEKITFFLSELPATYQAQELNQYFEAMNEAGKGLEKHEILKVRILKELPEEEIDRCTKIWNLASDMDTHTIAQKAEEINADYRQRVLGSIRSFGEGRGLDEFLAQTQVDRRDQSTIKKIEVQNAPPKEDLVDKSEKSILSFPDFLLQTLWLTIDNNEVPVTDFFDKSKLLKTFDEYLLKDDSTRDQISSFFTNLIRFKLIFDYFIIRTNDSDGVGRNYSLNFDYDATFEDNETLEPKRQLVQYQSMLYVSTTSYLWLSHILKYLDSQTDISYNCFITELKRWDDERHKKGEISLSYGSIDRYWFWRLDYYLWENRGNEFKEPNARLVADKYIFRPNRSIEHIAPQTPRSESEINLDDSAWLHQFGNLAMISSGQNSSLKNEAYEVKKAHVQSFVNRSVGGSIESLKLLKVHEFDTWNEGTIKKHHNEMVDILISSFGNQGEGAFLQSLKIE